MRELETSSADQEGLSTGEISMDLDPRSALSKLPLESLFLVEKPVPELSELVIRVPRKPQGWQQWLKDRQVEAVDRYRPKRPRR